MGQEASSIYDSPSTTLRDHPVHIATGAQPVSRSSPRHSADIPMAPVSSTRAAPADENITVAGPEYGYDPESEESGSRSIPPPSKFALYYAAPAVAQGTIFNGWMNNMCFPLPISDIETCCASTLLPCYQYGKTTWRLDQLRESKDASNHSYKAGQGCNIWCSTWAALNICNSGWVATGFQRNRVRATYGIKGSCANDFLIAYFCNCCVLMQADREIQAREGRSKFITNKKFNAREIVKREATAAIQPTDRPEMIYQPAGYQPGGDGSDWQPMSRPTQGSVSKVKIDHKKNTPFPMDGVTPSHRNSKVGSAYRNAKSEPPHRKTSDFALFDFSLFPKSKSSARDSIHSPKDVGQHLPGTSTPKKKYGSSGVEENAEIDENSNPGNQASGENWEEQTVNSEQETSRRSSETTITNWRHNSVKKTPKRSKAAKSLKMSYVHDFTDCPVNKEVLDYYERQQKRAEEAQQQMAQKDSTPGQVSASTSKTATPGPDHLNSRSPITSNNTSPSATPGPSHPNSRSPITSNNTSPSATREPNSEETASSTDTGSQKLAILSELPKSVPDNATKKFNSQTLKDPPKADEASGDRSASKKHSPAVEHSHDQCPRNLDGTSSDPGRSISSINTKDNTSGSSSPMVKPEEHILGPDSRKSKDVLMRKPVLTVATADIPEINEKIIGKTNEQSSERVQGKVDEKPTEKTPMPKTSKSHLLDESVISSHKNSQWDHDNQQNLRNALAKVFPKFINQDGTSIASQSSYSHQETQPESPSEHSLGETRGSSIAGKEQGGNQLEELPFPELQDINETNGASAWGGRGH